ncbi:histidine kinase dimerization/phospho-acceptor domain-containing protein [Streptomyces sp. x-19]|uniref:histidine kinase dimerization/phospho-acceptor domain-containing protein n=1 Tax=Streptomyces sp. x-19 TaxID=2789280 RepID=UPI003980B2A5
MKRIRLPGGERARLSTLYGGLLVLAGAMLIGLVNFLVREGLHSSISTAVCVRPGSITPAASLSPVPASPGPADPSDHARSRTIETFARAAEKAAQNRLLTVSLIALGAFAIIAMALAWWMARRVLRPVGVITRTAQRLSGDSLHGRIALDAPAGELKQLADIVGNMLACMEQLVGAQKRFAANVAHELRTPLPVQRAAAEFGLDTSAPAAVARIRQKLIEVEGTTGGASAGPVARGLLFAVPSDLS